MLSFDKVGLYHYELLEIKIIIFNLDWYHNLVTLHDFTVFYVFLGVAKPLVFIKKDFLFPLKDKTIS